VSAAIIDAQGVTVTYETRPVLDRVDLRVEPDSRIALVGPNGSGKSTLLRVLAGTEPVWSGSVYRSGEVGHLPQMGGQQGPATPREAILERVGVAGASRELDRQAALLGSTPGSWTGRSRRCRAARRHGPGWPLCASRGSRPCCWTSRPITWTPRAWTCWLASWMRRRAAW
jgi:ATPase subunit of ABC transporter with duplicated ATPase domains